MELIVVNKIVKQFIPNEDVVAFSTNDKGLINQTFIVSIGKINTKKFILQSINTAIFPLYKKGLENIILVKKELLKTNFFYSFPTPIQDKYICVDDLVWRMFPFIGGSVCYEKVKDKEL